MANRRNVRHLLAILILGGLACAIAIGIRFTHRKPLDGLWLGFTYYEFEGMLIKDVTGGEYLLRLNKDGYYSENGNLTSGTWTVVNDQITLKPTKFFDMTPAEHRKRFVNSDGKVSQTTERLLATKMKPMSVEYQATADRLIYRENSTRYEFERCSD